MAKIDSPNNEDFAKGVINDTYVRVLPRVQDWTPIVTDSFLSMTAEYTTGTVAVNAAGTAITGTGTTWTSGMTVDNGYKIKIAGNDNIYKFEYVGATSGTISPPLSGADNLSGKTYVIYRDEYALASDFDRFLKNGSVYVYAGGRIQDTVQEAAPDRFREENSAATSDPIKMVIIRRVNSSGLRVVQVGPPPKTAKVYPYEYVKRITPMSDYVTGTAAVTNASAVVAGTDTLWSTNAAVGDYFRLDGNGIGDSSKWYKILTVDSDVQITLDTVWGEATESGGEYVISKAPTAFPAEFHEAILYEALVVVIGEQGDRNLEGFALRKQEVMQDLKKNYKSRRTNVQVKVEDDGYR